MVIEDETFSYWPETLGMEDEEQSSIASSNSNYSIDKRLCFDVLATKKMALFN